MNDDGNNQSHGDNSHKLNDDDNINHQSTKKEDSIRVKHNLDMVDLQAMARLTNKIDDWGKRFREFTKNGDKDYVKSLFFKDSNATIREMQHYMEEYEGLMLQARYMFKEDKGNSMFYDAVLSNYKEVGDGFSQFSDRLK